MGKEPAERSGLNNPGVNTGLRKISYSSKSEYRGTGVGEGATVKPLGTKCREAN